MSKKRQNEVKRNIFLFDEVKKNIAGRIPETTRSENPFKRYPTTHQKQNVRSLIYDYLETKS